MSNRLTKLTRDLARNKSGNAMLMVALGMPALVGGAGLAVDTAQWYLWRQELQFAVDQAALAGAFARTSEESEDSFQNRARQEFGSNLTTLRGKTSAPVIALADYGPGGSDNSVVVQTAITQPLPFSSMITGRPVTVGVDAQAEFSLGGDGQTSCLIALDPGASKAVWFNGGPNVDAGCGVAALSNSSKAIEVSGGSGTLDLGWVISAGGIDDYFDDIDGTLVTENATDLIDPFSSLSPPDNATPRTLNCASSPATYTATFSVQVTVADKYYTGAAKNSLTLSKTTAVSSNTSTTTGAATSATRVGDVQVASSTTVLNSGSTGSGKSKVYYQTDRVTTSTSTVTNISSTGGSSGMLQPGTYSNFNVSGDCVMAPGIYVINGGSIDTQGGSLTGDGVMFVLKNGAGIKINGNAEVDLTAMSAAELMNHGVSAEEAEKLAGMLIFEDRDSSGNSQNKINGNSETILNGTIYLPNSPMEILGTAGVTSRCLTIAAATIKIGGTADLSTFCPPAVTSDVYVTTGESKVKLVG